MEGVTGHDKAIVQELLRTNYLVSSFHPDVASDTTARQDVHRGYAANFLSDATGTLAVTNAAGSVTAEELHRAILVTRAR